MAPRPNSAPKSPYFEDKIENGSNAPAVLGVSADAMDKKPKASLDSLLSHSGWVRQLAAALTLDAASADDLSQDALLTVLHRQPRAEESARPWLARVVRNLARSRWRTEDRRRARERGASRREALPGSDEIAAEVETQRILAEAIAELDDPARTVVVLRYFHGKSSAELAREQGVPEATVRSRLKRALDQLRVRLDSKYGNRSAWVALVAPLAAPPTAVGTGSSTVGAAGATGGLALSSKKVVLCVVLLAAIASLFLTRRDGQEGHDERFADANSPKSNLDIPADKSREPAGAEIEVIAQREQVALTTPTPDAETVKLHGRVVDADSDRGVAAADVALFAPRSTRLGEIRSRWHDRIPTNWNGSIAAPGWPRFGTDLDAEAAVELDEVSVYAPDDKADPIARTRTNEQGEFEIVAPRSLGFVTCTANGYAPSRVALAPPISNASNASELSIEIAMRAPRRLVGCIMDDDLKRIERSVRLRLSGRMRMSNHATRNLDGSPVKSFEPNEKDPQVETAIVETRPDGSFEIEMPTAIVFSIDCLDADLQFVRYGCLREDGTKIVSDGTTWPQPGLLKEPLAIVLRPVTWMRVTDRLTKSPIENIHLLCASKSTAQALRHGAYFAPLGCLRLAAWWSVLDEKWRRAEEESPCTCTVWADGYLPESHDIADLVQPQRIDFELERGNMPILAGRVHDRDRGVAGAGLSLARLLTQTWNTSSLVVIATAKSDVKGSFHLPMPAGRYVMKVTSIDEKRWQVVELPLTAPVEVDLSKHTSIVAEARDASGVVCKQFTIELNGADGRWIKRDTDDAGLARFDDLPPGTHVLKWSSSMNAPRRDADPELSVSLEAGESKRVDISLADCAPHFARLVVDGSDSLAGWKACVHDPESHPWIDIERGGRIPIDLCGVRDLRIENAGGRDWTVLLPKDAPDGYVIRLEVGGLGYAGVLIAQESGQPVGRTRIVTVPWDSKDRTDTIVCAVTDENGRFELTGLADHDYALRFEDIPRKSFTHEWIYVHPAQRPSSPPVSLTIALPKSKRLQGAFNALEGFDGIPQIRLSGTIRTRSGALPNTKGIVSSILLASGYSLLLETEFAVPADGTYAVHVPMAPRYEMTLHDAGTGRQFADVEWPASGTGDREVHDIEVP
jgi:RNA polymerase sigma-70 factor (ECF subfamily)